MKVKKVVINGEKYLEYEDWQTIGRFYRITVGTDWTREVKDEKGNIRGFEAKSSVYYNGTVIGGAEASCLRDESKWTGKPDFQLKSMAQTRACAKGLRNVLGFVPVLAGYKATPAEEMTDVSHGTSTPPASKPTSNGYATKMKDPDAPATDKQMTTLKSLAKNKLGLEEPSDIEAELSAMIKKDVSFARLTKVQASWLIGKLMEMKGNPPKDPEEGFIEADPY